MCSTITSGRSPLVNRIRVCSAHGRPRRGTGGNPRGHCHEVTSRIRDPEFLRRLVIRCFALRPPMARVRVRLPTTFIEVLLQIASRPLILKYTHFEAARKGRGALPLPSNLHGCEFKEYRIHTARHSRERAKSRPIGQVACLVQLWTNLSDSQDQDPNRRWSRGSGLPG
jgi:hypothetical protein